MNSRAMVIVGSVALAGAAVFLAVQILSIWPGVSSSLAVRRFDKARASGDRSEIEETAGAVLRHRPDDGSVRLLLARTILAGGDVVKAGSAYAEAVERSASGRQRAAAEIGKGVTLLLKASPPTPEDVAAAKQAFERALKEPSSAGDARAMLAVAHIWAGDLDAARAAAKAAKGPMGLETSATLACAKAYLAGAGGDSVAALQELRRAHLLAPTADTPVGAFASRTISVNELEAAVRPDADPKLRSKLIQHLKSEGAKAIADERTFPFVFRAALSCTTSKNEGERKMGMGLLSRAVKARPGDPMPLVAIAAVSADRMAPVWQKAEGAAKSEAARRAEKGGAASPVLSLLPGGGGAKSKAARANKPLVAIDKLGGQVARDLLKAAATFAEGGGEEGAARALGLFEYLFRMDLRAAELSGEADARRERELTAAGRAVDARKLLGDRVPAGQVSARLMRNAGALYARNAAWGEAKACFEASVALLPGQPDLKPYSESMQQPPRVVAVYPSAPGRLVKETPLVGAEFALPASAGGFDGCKLDASIGPPDGPRKALKPIVSGTGLWCVPKLDELRDGLVEVRFAVTVPPAMRVEAKTSFVVDSAPPEITSRFPEPDSVVTDRHTLIRIGWRDPSGLALSSVEVVLEPVAAATVRKVLVQKGLQKSGRFTGRETWKSKAPVVPEGAATAGTIVTGTMSELPVGVFRVRVRMRDATNQLREDAWKFTVR